MTSVEDIVVPRFGKVVVELPRAEVARYSGLCLRSTEEEDASQWIWPQAGQQIGTFPVVFAGSYELRAEESGSADVALVENVRVDSGDEIVVKLAAE